MKRFFIYDSVKEYLLMLMMIIIIVGGSCLFFLYYIDGEFFNKPLSQYDDILITNKAEYYSGETITASWNRCVDRKMKAPVIKHWSFVDGIIYNLPTTIGIPDTELGCHDVNIFITEVPENLPTGTYYLTGSIEYKVNKVKTKVYERQTNEFKIIK